MTELLKVLQKNRFIKLGLPFMTLLVAGSFGLKHFAQLRYTYSRKKQLTNEEAEELGYMKDKRTGEEHLEKLNKDIDTAQWDNIRGPRPWETTEELSELHEQMRAAKQRQRVNQA